MSAGPEELIDYVCKRLPIRSRIAGKERVSAAVMEVVARWPHAELQLVRDADRGKPDALRRLEQDIREAHGDDRYGSVILMFLLSTVISLVWQWWLSRGANRVKMVAWLYGMKGGS